MPDQICSNCIAFRCECTHVLSDAKKKRGPPKGTPRNDRSVAAAVTAILSTTKPFVIPEDSDTVRQLLIDLASRIKLLESRLQEVLKSNSGPPASSVESQSQQITFATIQRPFPTSILPPQAESTALDEELSESLVRLVLDQAKESPSGQVNHTVIAAATLEDQEDLGPGYGYQVKASLTNLRRPEFWHVYPWQLPPPEYFPPLVFPEEDLLEHLTGLYFLHFHPLVPILHRQTFERSVKQGHHFSDRLFGSVVLAVCFTASRLSNDKRVFDETSGTEASAGWKWFRQIRLIRPNFAVNPPSIHELQLYCLVIPFIGSSSSYHVSSALISLGLRFAQEMGAHRQKPGKPTIESELLKRAFWALYVLDVFVGSYMGRPRATSVDDFDVDLPIECDDEYWETSDPAQSFKQPPDRPSYVVYWNSFIKLLDILSFAQRTIFAVRRSDFWTAMGMSGPEWNEKVVSEIDSSLNKWIDSVPSHLKWGPQQAHHMFLQQSCCLYASYYWVQMVVHRAFIPKPGKSPVTRLPSMTICVNAARTCCRIVEIKHRSGLIPMLNVLIALYTSAIVLLLNAWRGKHLNTPVDIDKEMKNVYSCIEMLRLYESRWRSAGSCIDILRELIVLTGMNSEESASYILLEKSTKRMRDTEHNIQSEHVTASTSGTDDTMNMGLNQFTFNFGADVSLFDLPLSSTELGNLPLHGSTFWNAFEEKQTTEGDINDWITTSTGRNTDFASNKQDQELSSLNDFLTGQVDPIPGTSENIIWDDWDNPLNQVINVDELMRAMDPSGPSGPSGL
ncbi:hypothetical protein K435DRAFT_710727 [Dendrothele bispora CBS 962.96]|uniref:Xylanolytic transcriptional activator regulatory domain-containing protein n=1 Tax=Dendrothele bispora (strain CBS 962.96) TaxID=1314807 RepID=A0A4S8MUT1_DENBC|nr:hypothetical protein K435DRAFT_710727 [Dendrothele bispora CBS 962.96]